MPYPPLISLHRDAILSPAKIASLDRLTTEVLKRSLEPGQPGALKARPDGTMLDGHHRIFILRKRLVNVDALPREIDMKPGFKLREDG